MRLWGGRMFARSTIVGIPFSSNRDTRASPVPRFNISCSVSNAGLGRKELAAAFTAESIEYKDGAELLPRMKGRKASFYQAFLDALRLTLQNTIFDGKELRVEEHSNSARIQTSFNWWLHRISKESFGTLPVATLKTYEAELRAIFNKVTIKDDSETFENPAFDHQSIRSLIRRAFAPVRDYVEKEEILPCQASLLQIEKLTSPVEDSSIFYPSQKDIEQIKQWDNDPPKPNPEVQALIEKLRALGQDVSSLELKDPHPERSRTYHYLPYKFDSPLERNFLLKEIFPVIGDRKLEVYFNGDDALTEFKIKCYKQEGKHWHYLGYYFPDFLLIRRNAEGEIHQVVIIETKGAGFAPGFADKRKFMETEFLKKNNEKFGYKRFEFLYLEDTLTAEQRQQKVLETINTFFQ